MADAIKERLDKLLAWANANPDEATSLLDDMVVECKSDEAASVNNEGFTGQLSYLSHQYGIAELEKTILEGGQ